MDSATGGPRKKRCITKTGTRSRVPVHERIEKYYAKLCQDRAKYAEALEKFPPEIRNMIYEQMFMSCNWNQVITIKGSAYQIVTIKGFVYQSRDASVGDQRTCMWVKINGSAAIMQKRFLENHTERFEEFLSDPAVVFSSISKP